MLGMSSYFSDESVVISPFMRSCVIPASPAFGFNRRFSGGRFFLRNKAVRRTTICIKAEPTSYCIISRVNYTGKSIIGSLARRDLYLFISQRSMFKPLASAEPTFCFAVSLQQSKSVRSAIIKPTAERVAPIPSICEQRLGFSNQLLGKRILARRTN